MIKYELIPITHEQLRLFCALGGVIYVSVNHLRNTLFVACGPAEHLRRDIFLICSYPELYDKLSTEQITDIHEASFDFAAKRITPDFLCEPDNARLLTVYTCPDMN